VTDTFSRETYKLL